VRNASNYVAGIRVTESGTRVSVHGSAFHSCYYGVQAGDNTWVEISRSKFSDCQNAAVYAVTALGGSVTTVSVSDSAFGANYIGVFAEGQTVGAIIRVSIMRSSLAGNTYGIASVNDLAGPSTTVTLSGSNVTGNVYGYYQDGATLESTGDNLVRNNNATIGVLTPVSRM